MPLIGTEELLSQTGKVTREVARLLLHYTAGEKLPRMLDLARSLKSGNGTVQEAFSYLTKSGAVTLEAHGSQGSHLTAINYPLLWHYAGNDWIIGSMPLPYTLRYEGLATALYAQLEESELPFNMTYQRGSLSRGTMVRLGHYHYAVMSQLAAEYFIARHPEVTSVAHLPAESYVSEHVLISRVPREQIRRVGVDFTSLDEMLLTEAEFGAYQQWEKVPVTSAQVVELLQEQLFDAIIWNRDGLQVVPEQLQLLPLQGASHKRTPASQATIIALRDTPVRHVLLSIFSPEKITLLQKEVLARQRTPRY